MKEGCKKCPFNFESFSFKNVILVLLVIQAVWNLFKDNSKDIGLEDLLKNSLSSSSPLESLPLDSLPLGNLTPLVKELGPLMGELKMSCPRAPPAPPKMQCGGGSWMLTKVLLILLFLYLIYFIKTIIEKISVGMELNVNTGVPCMECPLGFGKRNVFCDLREPCNWKPAEKTEKKNEN